MPEDPLNKLMDAMTASYLADLERDGIPDPLHEPLTLWCVLTDFYRMLEIDEADMPAELRACWELPIPAA